MARSFGYGSVTGSYLLNLVYTAYTPRRCGRCVELSVVHDLAGMSMKVVSWNSDGGGFA